MTCLKIILVFAGGLLIAANAQSTITTTEDFRRYCDESKFSLNNNGDLVLFEHCRGEIFNAARNPSIDQDAVWLVMRKILKIVCEKTSAVNADPAYNKIPSMNIGVEGLPVSGMAVEHVQDPIVRKRYQEAIDANNAVIASLKYKIGLNKLCLKILSDARAYVKASKDNATAISNKSDLLNSFEQVIRPVPPS